MLETDSSDGSVYVTIHVPACPLEFGRQQKERIKSKIKRCFTVLTIAGIIKRHRWSSA